MRICSGAGCTGICADDVRYCSECAKDETTAHKPTSMERAKDDPIQHQYVSTRWKKFRLLVLQRFPFCAVCRLAVSRVADHIVPAKLVCSAFRAARLFPVDPWAGFYIQSNTEGLCHKCHNEKTRTEPGKDYADALAAIVAKYTPRPQGS